MKFEELSFKNLELLSALLNKRSVSGAARSLDIPQPSASHGLKRLRDALDDQLLVRVKGGMEPTPRALKIADAVDKILETKELLHKESEDFSASRLKRRFNIACSDLGQMIFLPALYNDTKEGAPQICFNAMVLSKEQMSEGLENGQVDLAFGAYPKLIAGIYQQTVYRESYLCFVHPDHPFAKQPDEETFISSRHIIVSTRGMAHAHRKIENGLISRVPESNIKLITSSFLVALGTSSLTDLIITAPGNEMRSMSERFGLIPIEPPFLLPGFEVNQYWHTRSQDDPGHKWLRQKVYASMAHRRK